MKIQIYRKKVDTLEMVNIWVNINKTFFSFNFFERHWLLNGKKIHYTVEFITYVIRHRSMSLHDLFAEFYLARYDYSDGRWYRDGRGDSTLMMGPDCTGHKMPY